MLVLVTTTDKSENYGSTESGTDRLFNENGYLVVEQAVDPQLLEKLTADFGEWVEESR